jgi:hypothetical protein
MRKFKLSTIIVLLLFLLLPQTVNSFSGGVTISPALSELSLKPGEAIERSLSITNNESSDLSYSVEIQKLDTVNSIGDYSIVELTEDEPPILAVDILEFEIKSQETYELPLRLSVPTNTEESSFYPALVVKVGGAEDLGAVSQVVSLFYINVDRDGQKVLNIDNIISAQIDINKKIVFFPENVFNVKISNNSNRYIKPFGNVRLLKNNELVRDIPVNQELKILLPFQSIEKELIWSEAEDLKSKLVPKIGKYRAVFAVQAEEGVTTVEQVFLLIPGYHIIAGVFFLLTLFFIFQALRLSRSEKKNPNPHQTD